MDPASDEVAVTVEVLGRPFSLTFHLSLASQHLALFGDQPLVPSCPNERVRKQGLLSQHPEPDTIFQSYFLRSMTWLIPQISQCGSDHRLILRTHNMTWPAREPMYWATLECPLADEAWETFMCLVDLCGFWQLPYDDGHRVRRDTGFNCWELEGYMNGRYHAVVRRTVQKRPDIADCCDYLFNLAQASEQPPDETAVADRSCN